MPKDGFGNLLVAAKQIYDHMATESDHMDIHDLQATSCGTPDDISELEDAKQLVPASQRPTRQERNNRHNHAPNYWRMQSFLAYSVVIAFLALVVISTVTHNSWAAFACIGALAYALRKVINHYFKD